MASPDLTLPRPRVGVAGRARAAASRVTARPELLALVALAAVLNLWALDLNGYANEYYSAAVRSMTDNWHAFLFASFDSSGVMTVDKPPLAFWVQALSARIFGFGSWSILVPQALMGVASVALTYDLTRRVFGRWAGTAAGLALALTPIAVAISRHNNPDALLVLCSVGALWALVRGLENGRTRWLLLSGALIGLGFETKMAAALTIVPGIVLAWLWIAPRGRRAAIGQLAGFSGVAAAVGLAWPVLVWLTPAANRPWVSGTSDNSIWSLIFGYNGLGRLFGQSGGPGGGNGGPGGGGGGMGGVFGGETGPFRLLNSALGGQAGWLLGAAVVVAIALLVLTRLRRDDARSGWLLAIGGAWLVTAVAFSRAEGIFHPYYVSLLAPFTAALVGAGVGIVVRGGTAARIVGPLMIAGGIVTSLVVIDRSATDMAWLRPLLIGGGVVAAVVLALGLHRRIRQTAIAAAIALMLFAPASWAVDTLGYATSSTFPAGGPSGSAMGGPGGMGGGPGGGGGGRFGGPGGQGGPPSGGINGGVPPAVAGGAAGSSGGGSGSSSSSDGAGLPPGTTVDPSSGSGSSGSGTTSRNARGGMGGPGGGMGGLGGGNAQTLTSALAYAKQHGGGVVAVSSQNGAASQLLTRDPTAQVAAIGGFSGRESQVTVDWLADAVEAGRIRWVLSDGGDAGPPTSLAMRGDDRVGASDVLALAAQVGTAVSSVDGLYDLQGTADALRAAG